ncbi:MAG: diaminopimelate epimerase [Pyrinomonadaceae bacterium]
MTIPFSKFHGFGNDYIVIEVDAIAAATLDQLAIAICNRNTGAGADGIAVLEKRDGGKADYFCEIINPDGSRAGFSGNGTRCAAAYLHHKRLWSDENLRLETRSGVKNYKLIEQKDGLEFWFEAEIGKPLFKSGEIPVTTDAPREAIVNEPIFVVDCHYSFAAVNVGNPVACLFVDDFDLDWRGIGKAIEKHEKFPSRTNVVFVKVRNRENLDIRIWERGAGETSSSGTCSAAAAVMSMFMLKADRVVSVQAVGGTTEIQWRDDDEIIITGRADFAYDGEWPA